MIARSPWATSILLHASLILPIIALSWLDAKRISPAILEVEWIQPQQTATEVKTTPTVPQEIEKRKATTKPTKPVERVFGIDTDSLRTDSPDGIVLKEGNTIAKEIDQTKLVDKTPLPVPKPEFLISQMPVLKSKPDIPYPSEARKKEIEGKVVLNILIDENGNVRRAELINGPGFGLNEVAMKKIYEFVFQPAKIGEQNVPVQIRYAVTFQLRT